ncbi:unnamed protein product [Phytophthora fragariaefolia]|uniref:Unnamed protein product n=1 Tax=Phytophthora fragariaefolia TaxID=1490495 RepID=A0A9W6XV33_9STRA|nr:unnamed protein product [Phytophthora fragariaefolia]
MAPPPLTSVADVHKAWLTAGANGDAATMRELWSRCLIHFQQVGHAKSDSPTQRQPRFCSWRGFHLRTIGSSALHTASWGGNLAIVELLLKSGQNPNAGDESGMTAMMVAILRLNLMTMRCVLRDGEAVRRNIVVDVKGGLLVTNLLLSRGATIDVEDKDGVSPLELSRKRSNVNALQLFLNHHQCVATPKRHNFAGAVLLKAVQYQAEEVIRFVVENEHTSVAVSNAQGETPMHLAIKQRDPSLMELLNGFDPAGDNLVAVTVKSDTPAHYAARFGSHREMEMLLLWFATTFGDLQELGPVNPLNAVNNKGMTSLYVAGATSFHHQGTHDLPQKMTILKNRNTKVQLLLDNGAKLFPPGFLVNALSPKYSSVASHLSLPVQVQHCLRAWVVENRSRADEPENEDAAHAGHVNDSAKAVAELCMNWIASAACVGSSATLLPIIIGAGYALDLVPLLIEFPLRRCALPVVLHQFETFARSQGAHALLLQLHTELLEACHALSENTRF